MTDKQWQKLIVKAHKLAIKHIIAMQAAEEEYVRRFGIHPSDSDDDWWIDYVHYGMGADSGIEKITEEALRHKSYKEGRQSKGGEQ
jgi:ribosomal protein L4